MIVKQFFASFFGAIYLLFMALLFSHLFVSCSHDSIEDMDLDYGENPFDTMEKADNDIRKKVVVISDIHLGPDLAYSETVKHLPRLCQFLQEVRRSKTVAELIIGGDLLDEWYLPSRENTFQGKSSLDYVKQIYASNRVFFDVINKIIKEGYIKVTYVPGNHDLLITQEDVQSIMPGINFVLDEGRSLGTGTYRPDACKSMVVEHCHRYDWWCAPNPYDNQDIAQGTIMPLGYFFSRVAANSFTSSICTPQSATKLNPLTINPKFENDPEQKNLQALYDCWNKVLSYVIYVDDNFNEPIIKTDINGWKGSFSVNDFVPFNNEDGSVTSKYYRNIMKQSTWDKVQDYNFVKVKSDINKAIYGGLNTQFLDTMSEVQYFKNMDKQDVRIVVFGHTHVPKFLTFDNIDSAKCIYVNSGTWQDKKVRNFSERVDQDGENMDFVIVSPATSGNTIVALYKYFQGTHKLVKSEEIDL